MRVAGARTLRGATCLPKVPSTLQSVLILSTVWSMFEVPKIIQMLFDPEGTLQGWNTAREIEHYPAPGQDVRRTPTSPDCTFRCRLRWLH